MKAALYSRFSTDRQNESSIADQVRVCTECVERQGWKVVERFEDQGTSGAALGNRPGVLMLQDGALALRFDVVVAIDLSRLSRSQGDLSKMIDRLTAKGVRVIGVQDGYDSARRGHKLQAGLSGIIGMGSAIRVIVRNERYRGVIHWNTSEWRKDPDGGKRKRVMRPRSEWISYVDESLRIVSDDLWNRAQRRTQPAKDDKRFKTGGRPKFLLSGLLVCDACGAHYTITDQRSYGCSSHHDGRAC